jgi:hypothetical protein
MKSLKFTGTLAGQDLHLVRVDKRKARNLFNRGLEIYLCPSNFKPFKDWFIPVLISENKPYYFCESLNFDDSVDCFQNYSCLNNYTGYFPSFYINTQKL